MKVFNYFVAIAFMLSMVACTSSSESEANKKLGKLEIEIPAELKDNPEICEYIKTTTQAVDEYALLLDRVCDEVKDIDPDNMSMVEQIKVMKVVGEYTLESAKLMVTWGEAVEKRALIEENLSDAEIEALAQVFTHFENRLKQIDEKYAEEFDGIDKSKEEGAEE